jgi:integral membrane protein
MAKLFTVRAALHHIGFWEAISYLVLLLIAMPLKYIWLEDAAVRIVGMLHGVLWIPYVGLAFIGALQKNWSWRIAGYLFIASLLPAGPIIAEKKLFKRES